MTRINLIAPSELHRKHLQAEYYELPELFRLVRNRQDKGHTPTDCRIPASYRFGTGHKTFFYNKLFWLASRYSLLVSELHARGHNINPILLDTTYLNLHKHWWGDWTPSDEEIALSRERILQRERELGL